MLVIAHEQPLRIRGERRLSRSRETEEQRGAVRLRIRRRGAMHGQDALLRHQVVHDREDALLHLPGVLGAENHDFPVLEAQVDGGRRESGGLVGSWKLAGVVDDVVRIPEALQLLGGRADEHVVHEEGMVGARADDPHLDLVLGIPAGEAVDAEDRIAEIEEVSRTLSVELEQLRLDRKVDGPPPDLTL